MTLFTDDKDTLDFYVDLFNHHNEGLDDVEIWIHTCWGNPGAQHCFDPNVTYETSIDMYLNRVKGDICVKRTPNFQWAGNVWLVQGFQLAD